MIQKYTPADRNQGSFNRRPDYRQQRGGYRDDNNFRGRPPRRNFHDEHEHYEPLTEEDIKIVAEMEALIKDLMTKINATERMISSKESDFRVENLSKTIVLETLYEQKSEGELVDIDKYRIVIIENGKKKYYFKHALANYYLKV